ncbi:MAG: type II secretion system protein GspC, partial [Gammaproteobacteria bacterium]
LDLTLKGTIWDSEGDRAVAIIEYRNEEKVYSIGDPVVAGATLYWVEPHRVILQRAGGRLEELSLSEPSRISASARPVNRQSSRLSLRNTSRNTMLRRAADSGALSEVIRPQPHFADGRLKGYRIYPGRQRRTFAELGFRPGDLATSINGVPLTDPEQSTNLLAGIDQGSQVTVTVERNGIPEVITIDLEQISSALQKLPPGSQSR